MSCERNQCYASCPPMTVTVQPPPFVLNIPGPSIYCPDQPFCIEQFNPCAAPCQAGGNSGNGYAGGVSNSRITSMYSQMSKGSSQGGPCSFY